MQTELTDEFQSALPSLVRVLQIIVGAMVIGCVMFLVIATQLDLGEGADAAGNQEPSLFEFVALAFLGMAVIIRLTVPRVVVAASLRKILDQT